MTMLSDIPDPDETVAPARCPGQSIACRCGG